jgi:DNA helicase II / ATP-dependent DNA helicase PcrA
MCIQCQPMDVSHIIDSLNDAQREAVTAPPGHQLVLAGAGSGKTRVLVQRIAWLIQVEHLSPHNILAVTFTNKSAREMRHRLESVLEVSSSHIPVRQMWVGTFHGLAHRLLKLHWKEAGLPENFQILDSDDQLRLVKRILKSLDLDESRFAPKQAQWFISAQKDEGKRAAYLHEGGDFIGDTLIRIYKHYEEACERGGLVDFGELLLRSHELWLKNPALLAHYQQRFKHVLVDEFQDTNTIQYAWLRVLAGKHSFVTAVGDDDQSIYGWRGARIENIQHFPNDFSGVTLFRLEQNYRSTSTILKAANAVIANNLGRLGKQLWTNSGEGEPISLYAGFNEYDEARFIVDRIQGIVRDGNNRSDIAILYRSNAQSRVLEEALLREGIPYRIYGGQRFYDRMEIKNAIAYLRLIQNRDDDAAFERVINTPTRGIGERTVEMIRECARQNSFSLWKAAGRLLSGNTLAARAASTVNGFLELVKQLDSETDELTLMELCDHVIKKSGLIEFHKKEKGEKGQQRVDNLEELVNACDAFEPETDELSPLQEFLDRAALDAGEKQAGENEDSVQLMTLHSAKGLEFPYVFLAGMEENLFPHRMSMEDGGGIEEERRLCYVGLTRAMQKLYLTYAEVRRLHGEEHFNAPSRFIREIPKGLVQEVRLKAEVSRPASYLSKGVGAGFDSAQPALPERSRRENELSLGQRVFHNSFGEGMIIDMEGSGARTRVQINFDRAGTKWLMLSHANLQVM